MDLFDIDPDSSLRSNFSDGWWDRLTADSPLWSADGSSAREHFPIIDFQPPRHTSANTSDSAPGAESPGSPGAGAVGADAADAGGRPRARSSWVLVGSLRESAQALALTPLPEDVDVCLAETEDLLFARDRITCALADRVGRVHAAGRAKQHGHASTRSWLRTAAGMSVAGASRLLTLAVELARLPRVREKFAAGQLAAGVVEAICTATAQLSDEHAGLAEPILLELAGKAGAAEVAKAGRYLRAVLDPDGEDRDARADYGRRFLRVRPGRGGGLEGEFYLPREAAARLRALLDAYAKPRAEGDDRPLSVRQADALIALLEQKIATELLVLVNAKSLPPTPSPTPPPPPTTPWTLTTPEALTAPARPTTPSPARRATPVTWMAPTARTSRTTSALARPRQMPVPTERRTPVRGATPEPMEPHTPMPETPTMPPPVPAMRSPSSQGPTSAGRVSTEPMSLGPVDAHPVSAGLMSGEPVSASRARPRAPPLPRATTPCP
ncbi:DUF222 domain-containing protein [Microbispora rosea]|uniref:DUF222 domain-containing protein n=1 Tax=Microbispora rosea TaxID=58117 RepID=UPI0037C50F6C